MRSDFLSLQPTPDLQSVKHTHNIFTHLQGIITWEILITSLKLPRWPKIILAMASIHCYQFYETMYLYKLTFSPLWEKKAVEIPPPPSLAIFPPLSLAPACSSL